MNRDEIKTILPHREPMLLIDEAERLEDGSARGCYTVRGDEWFLQGHFPGSPVVPGVLLCEMMAQTCCALLTGDAACKAGTLPYFTSLDKVRFRRKVLPGETLTIECRIVKEKGPFRFASGTGTVHGELAVSAEFSFALV